MSIPNFPTCHSHIQSLDSASTPEAFAKREIELGTGVLTVTDHGSLAACRAVYDLAKKKKLTPILGLEGYFRDDNCEVLTKQGVPKNDKGTYSDYIKYHHITMHYLDQAAYECAVRVISDAPIERHGQETKPLFNWANLEELASYNTTMTTGCLVGMVQRHLLDNNDPQMAIRYYEKLRSIVKPGNFFVEVFPHVCDRNWVKGVFVSLQLGDKVERIKFWDEKKLKTNAGEISAEGLARNFGKKGSKHEFLNAVMNYRKWEDREPAKIVAVERIEDFMPNECRPWCPNGDVQQGCNEFMMRLAKKYGDPILIGDDSHFANPEEKRVQDVRLMASGGSWRFYGSYHRKSSEEALKYFREKLGIKTSEFEGWVDNAYAWSARFKDFVFKTTPSLPTKFYPKDTLAHTMALIEKHGRMDWSNKADVHRLRQEIELLHKNGTIDLLPYFFVGEEVCWEYTKRGLLTGPGRGSAAGLILAYLLGITHVHPLRYGLSLERFITLDRIKSGALPDIDQDLPHRDLLVDPKDHSKGFLPERFGDHFAQISVDVSLKLRSTIKDVARVLMGKVPPEIDALTRKLPEAPQGVTEHDFVFGYEDSGNTHIGIIETDPVLREYVATWPTHWDIVRRALGLARQKSRHPCGFIIADKPIKSFIPLTIINDTVCTAYTPASVEAVGGVKMDFLVINSLNDLGAAVRLIQSRAKNPPPVEGMKIDGKWVPQCRMVPHADAWRDIWDLPEDQSVFRDVATGKTETVFQFNTPGAVQWLRQFAYRKGTDRFAIDSIETMAAFTALDRPGPLDMEVSNPETGEMHNLLVEYARRARGAEPSLDILPAFNKLFPESFGIMCVAEDSYVKTKLGSIKIQNVQEGDLVQTETGTFNKVSKFLKQGKKECVSVRLTNGEELTVTADHKVLTQRGWVEAGELTTADIVRQYWTSDEKIEEGDDRDWVIGLLLADGDVCAGTPNIACSSEAFAESVKKIADKAWGLDCRVCKSGRTWYCHLRHERNSGTTPNPLTRYIESIGLRGCCFDTKRFPSKVTKAMATGFYEGDGCLFNNRLRVKNESLARRFFEVLQALRINSSFYSDSPGVWTVSVCGYLPLRVKEYKRELDLGFTKREKMIIPRSSGSDRNHLRMKRSFITNRVALKLHAKYGGFSIDQNPWGRVLSLRPAGERETFDLSVENEHSFVVGGSVVHNCYQEQLQFGYQKLTGCDGATAESFRRDIAKKKMEKVLAVYPAFIESASKQLGRETAEAAWEFFKTWAKYGFNKSHSVCYSVIAYACAYLKHHHPLEWWVAVLRNADKEEINEKFWRYCGHLIDLPDAQKSEREFEIKGNRIQAPLSLLHGIGETAHAQLMLGSPYTSIEDFCNKQQLYRESRATMVEKVVKKTKTDRKTKEKVVTETTVMTKKLGSSALHRGMVYTMIVSGSMDSLFPPETTTLDQLEAYEAALARATGKKQSPVQPKFLDINQFTRYQRRKEILPAFSAELLPMFIERKVEGLIVGDTTQYRWGRTYLPFASAEVVERLSTITPWPEEVKLCCAAYVEKVERWNWGPDKSKTACKFTLDIDGVRMKLVKWGDRDTGKLPERFCDALKGAIVVAVMSKYKEGKPFNLEDVVVVQPPLSDAPPEVSPEPETKETK